MPEMQNSLVRQTEEEIKKKKKRDYANNYYARNREKLQERNRLSQKKQYKQNPERFRAKTNRYNAIHRKEKIEYSHQYRERRLEYYREYDHRYYIDHREYKGEKDKIRRSRLKIETFEHYGGAICRCCGEKVPEFLSIDHIKNGRGNPAERLKNFYQWLKTNNYPSGFQVLCMMCNWAKSQFGSCPHTQLKTPIDSWLER